MDGAGPAVLGTWGLLLLIPGLIIVTAVLATLIGDFLRRKRP